MTEAKIIRFPLKDVRLSQEDEFKELVDVEKLPEVEEKNGSEDLEYDNTSNTSPKSEEPEQDNKGSEQNSEYEDGYAKGLEEGKRIGLEEAEDRNSIMQNIESKLSDLELKRQEYIAKITEEAGILAVSLAKKMIGNVSNADEQRISRFLDDVISKIQDENKINIYVDKSYEKFVINKIEGIKASLANNVELKVVIKEEFTEGKCEVDWNLGKAVLDPSSLMESFERDFKPKEEKSDNKENTDLKNTPQSDDIKANSKDTEE